MRILKQGIFCFILQDLFLVGLFQSIRKVQNLILQLNLFFFCSNYLDFRIALFQITCIFCSGIIVTNQKGSKLNCPVKVEFLFVIIALVTPLTPIPFFSVVYKLTVLAHFASCRIFGWREVLAHFRLKISDKTN